jgi:hypothetical protein
MEVILLIYHDEKAWTALAEESRAAIYKEYRAYVEDLSRAGKYRAGGEFQGSSTALTVQVRSSRILKSNGPFSGSREQLAGFFLVEVNDMEEAANLAARIPTARDGTIELRAILS